MNENLADEIRKTIESIKDIKIQVGGINNYLSILEGMMRADIQKKVDDAYQKGYDAGIIASSFVDKSEEAYQRGLDDAWEAARKVAQQWEEDTDTEHRLVIDDSIRVTLDSMTASEAIAKLKAYEEKQKADDKIEIGDEVEWDNDFTGDRFIVTRIYQPYGKKEQCDGIDDDGDVYRAVLIESLVKTGRHFDIAGLLEEMKE